MTRFSVYSPLCYLAHHGRMEKDDPMPACEGVLVRCHLIPKQRLAREFPNGAVRIDGRWQKWVEGLFLPDNVERHVRTTRELQDDPRAWVLGCGGPQGNGGHHGMLDFSKRLRLPFAELPVATIEYAEELGLLASIERMYR